MGVGGFIFDFVGAVVRWIYGTIWRTLFRRKKYSFKEYLNGPNNSDDWFDQTGHSFVNRIVGAVFIVLLVMIFSL